MLELTCYSGSVRGAFGGTRIKGYSYRREISGVSPPELMMMPSVRGIDMAVDVVLGTAPTTTAPHWTLLVEQRES